LVQNFQNVPHHRGYPLYNKTYSQSSLKTNDGAVTLKDEDLKHIKKRAKMAGA
jgi:hypothetical protein